MAPRQGLTLATALFLLWMVPYLGAQEEAETHIIEEMEVSAQKKVENVQDIPIAITVFDAGQIQERNMDRAREIAGQTPNLQIKQGVSHALPNVFIRGVGVNDFNVNVSGAVGYYLDEVYLGSPASQGLLLFDMARIEVLRGPQGTLYGKNTTGGAINFITKKPSGKRESTLELTVGRFDQLNAEGAFETPLSDTASVRLAFMTENRDGYTKNTFDDTTANDRGSVAGRLSLGWRPNDDFDLLLRLHAGRVDTGAPQSESLGTLPGEVNMFGYREIDEPWVGAFDRPDDAEQIDTLGLALTLHRHFNSVTLTSVTALDKNDRLLKSDPDSSPTNLDHINWHNKFHQITQELRLSSKADGPLSWIAGLYYLSDSLDVDNYYDLYAELLKPDTVSLVPGIAPLTILHQYGQDTTSYAAFGQMDYAVNDSLKLTAGLRYTHEEKDFNLSSGSVTRGTRDITGLLIEPIDRKSDEGEVSGRLSLAYKPSEHMLWFASFSRGFRGGSFNGGAFVNSRQGEPVRPETMNALEAGFKSTLMDHRLLFNVTGFYYDYKDLQVFNVSNEGSFLLEILDNASDARYSGLEMESRMIFPGGLDLRLGMGLLDAEYLHYVIADGRDLSGNRPPLAPELTYNLALSYGFAVGDGLVHLVADHDYTDHMEFDPFNEQRIADGDYGLINAKMEYSFADDRFAVSLWGKNLTNEVYRTESLDASVLTFDLYFYGEPRTYGLTLRGRF